MRLKRIIAGAIAGAVMAAAMITAVGAEAATVVGTLSPEEEATLVVVTEIPLDEATSEATAESVADGGEDIIVEPSGDGKEADTGSEGAAVLFGVAIIATGAVAVSRKK